MKSLDENIKNRNVKAIFKHPRLKMLDEFHKRINAERKAVDMKVLPMSAIAVKTSHLSVQDMAYLLKRCSQSSNFSRCFFGSLKVKNGSKNLP
jgi:phospholipid N-methyltransferase